MPCDIMNIQKCIKIKIIYLFFYRTPNQLMEDHLSAQLAMTLESLTQTSLLTSKVQTKKLLISFELPSKLHLFFKLL